MKHAVTPIRAATFVYPEGHPEGPGADSIFVFLVRTPSGAWLVDTGIGTGEASIDEHYRPQRVDLHEALRANGVDPGRLAGIICSHLHFDHCGNNRAFAGVPIHVQRAEYDAAHGDNYTVPEWLDFPGSDYRLLDGQTRLAEGLDVYPTPGHTPGHQSIAVRSAAGFDLIVAQAAQTARDFSAFHASPVADDASSRSLALLKALRPDRAWFSHDENVWTPQARP